MKISVGFNHYQSIQKKSNQLSFNSNKGFFKDLLRPNPIAGNNNINPGELYVLGEYKDPGKISKQDELGYLKNYLNQHKSGLTPEQVDNYLDSLNHHTSAGNIRKGFELLVDKSTPETRVKIAEHLKNLQGTRNDEALSWDLQGNQKILLKECTPEEISKLTKILKY